MLKFLAAFALAAAIGAPAALADGAAPPATPEKRPAPTLKRSPTDEYTPETRRTPRTYRRETRIAKPGPRARGLTRSGTEPLAYSFAPSLLAPGAGPATRALGSEIRSYYDAPAWPGHDGAPCPTRSSTSLAELFACTLR